MKKKYLEIFLFAILLPCMLSAQGSFYSKSGRISFYSSTRVENIEAINKSVGVVLNTGTGDLTISALMKGFEFKKALMQEHFNSKFVESDKYPKASFNGKVINNASINYAVNGTYNVTVKGNLTLHGQTKELETPGTITVKDGKLLMNAVFNVTLADFKITVPRMYTDNISKTIRVTVDFNLAPLPAPGQ